MPVSTVGGALPQPPMSTLPSVGSAVTEKRLAASLRTDTGLPPWTAFSPGTSLAVLTITLMGVAYSVHLGLLVLKVMAVSLTVAVQAMRAWR